METTDLEDDIRNLNSAVNMLIQWQFGTLAVLDAALLNLIKQNMYLIPGFHSTLKWCRSRCEEKAEPDNADYLAVLDRYLSRTGATLARTDSSLGASHQQIFAEEFSRTMCQPPWPTRSADGKPQLRLIQGGLDADKTTPTEATPPLG